MARFPVLARSRARAVSLALTGQHQADQDPAELFAHVYAQPTPALAAQREFLLAEIAEGDRP